MPKTALYNMEGAAIGEIELSDDIFAAEINVAAMHLVVRSILANKRQGTQSAKTRTEVRGGGRKIYRQKGTGNARHHGNRAPQFTHGGVVFAPKPRDYVIAVPKKVRRAAFKSALTSKLQAGEIMIVDELKAEQAVQVPTEDPAGDAGTTQAPGFETPRYDAPDYDASAEDGKQS